VCVYLPTIVIESSWNLCGNNRWIHNARDKGALIWIICTHICQERRYRQVKQGGKDNAVESLIISEYKSSNLVSATLSW